MLVLRPSAGVRDKTQENLKNRYVPLNPIVATDDNQWN